MEFADKKLFNSERENKATMSEMYEEAFGMVHYDQSWLLQYFWFHSQGKHQTLLQGVMISTFTTVILLKMAD